MDARRVWSAVAALGAVLCAVSTFFPWVRSGRVNRSGMEVARSAKRIGLLDDGTGQVVASAWFLVPLAAALALTLWAVGRPLLCAAASSYCAFVLLAASRRIGAGPLPTETGVAWGERFGWLTAVGALALVAVALRDRFRAAGAPGGEEKSAPVSSRPVDGGV